MISDRTWITFLRLTFVGYCIAALVGFIWLMVWLLEKLG